jgi:hypothetical protein
MVELGHLVRQQFGGVDYLASNLRPFQVGASGGAPDYITGQGHYWWCLSPDQMMRFESLVGELLTLGPKGVADVARAANARLILPYAHWWRVPRAADEEEMMLIRELAANSKGGASVRRWAVGDGINGSDGSTWGGHVW